MITVDNDAMFTCRWLLVIVSPATRTMVFVSHVSHTRSAIHTARSYQFWLENDCRVVLFLYRYILHYTVTSLSGGAMFLLFFVVLEKVILV